MDKVINVTKQCGLKHTVLKGAEISAKFPILHVPSNYIAVYQEDVYKFTVYVMRVRLVFWMQMSVYE